MQYNSRKTYDCALRMYTTLVSEDKALHQEGLSIFMNKLKEKGYSQSTIRLYYYAIVRTLKELGCTISTMEPPEIDQDNVKRHIYSNEEISELVHCAIDLGGIYSKALAFSTVYGLRRTELSNLTNSNYIDVDNKVVKIKAVKGGKTVLHKIPDEIIKFINNDVKFLGLSGMTRIFNTIATESGLNDKGSGWHSIRRTLVTGLLMNRVPQEIVMGFMRWKTKTMLDIYHIRNPMEDVMVFENHPFLHMWR